LPPPFSVRPNGLNGLVTSIEMVRVSGPPPASGPIGSGRKAAWFCELRRF